MDDAWVIVSLIVVTAIFSYFSGYGSGFENGHKQGQIDALTGKVSYHLVQQATTKRNGKKLS